MDFRTVLLFLFQYCLILMPHSFMEDALCKTIIYNYICSDVVLKEVVIKHTQSILESVPNPNQKVSDVCSLDLY